MSDYVFEYRDESEEWLKDVIENHHEEALSRVAALLAETTEDEHGCWVRATQKRPKVRFRQRQVAVARFVYCVQQSAVISKRVVIRHRCHNERCCRPEHLQPGPAADNKRDDWEYWANGVNYELL